MDLNRDAIGSFIEASLVLGDSDRADSLFEELDPESAAVGLEALLAGVVEVWLGQSVSWADLRARAVQVARAREGSSPPLIVIEASLRLALGHPEAIRGLSSDDVADAVGLIITEGIDDLEGREDASSVRGRVTDAARSHLTTHLNQVDSADRP